MWPSVGGALAAVGACSLELCRGSAVSRVVVVVDLWLSLTCTSLWRKESEGDSSLFITGKERINCKPPTTPAATWSNPLPASHHQHQHQQEWQGDKGVNHTDSKSDRTLSDLTNDTSEDNDSIAASTDDDQQQPTMIDNDRQR
ncbi:hypothetical protein EDB85DRAFT_1886730 [Lactarius pseudohatsudake]|nr:hypothetical protein EDB85DRAFT_1886730 [Lactarius pseudohatsudake]